MDPRDNGLAVAPAASGGQAYSLPSRRLGIWLKSFVASDYSTNFCLKLLPGLREGEQLRRDILDAG